jgi:hypothetical protein
MPENVQDFEDRGNVDLLNPQGGRAVGVEDRRGRGSQFQLLIRKRKDGGRKLASGRGRGSHHQKEMVVVRVQEGIKGGWFEQPWPDSYSVGPHCDIIPSNCVASFRTYMGTSCK